MESFRDANLKQTSKPEVRSASMAATRGGAASSTGCHHFGVTSFYVTNGTNKKTTICLITLEMFSKWNRLKNDLKQLLKYLFRGGALVCQKYNPQFSKKFKNIFFVIR